MYKSHSLPLFAFLCWVLASIGNGALAAEPYPTDAGREVWAQRGCGRCHGSFAEGRPCHDIPRLAGASADYLRKRLGEHPFHPRNPYAFGAARLTPYQIDALATDLAAIDLRGNPRFDVYQRVEGDTEAGAKLYREECRVCHGKTGYGRAARADDDGTPKAVPPLAGQLPGYLQRAIREFQLRRRVHDDTPDDDLFDQLGAKELQNLTAYLATLDDVPTTSQPSALPAAQCPRL